MAGHQPTEHFAPNRWFGTTPGPSIGRAGPTRTVKGGMKRRQAQAEEEPSRRESPLSVTRSSRPIRRVRSIGQIVRKTILSSGRGSRSIVLKTRADDSRVSQAANRGAAWARPGRVLAVWKEVHRGVLRADINGWTASRRPAAMAGVARPALTKLPAIRYRRAIRYRQEKTMHVPLRMPSLCTVISPISAAAGTI